MAAAMSDEDYDEESFAAFENELYGIQSDSDDDIDSEVEDALYSQLHHSFSATPGEDDCTSEGEGDSQGQDDSDNGPLPLAKARPAEITISDDDADDNDIDKRDNVYKTDDMELYIVDEVGDDDDTSLGHDDKSKSSMTNQKENWDLIDKDMEDESSGGKRTASRYYGLNTKLSHIRCHNCNEKGHLSRDCPLPRKISCVLCGTSGHMRTKCPNQLCFNCLQPGHRSSDCTKVRVRWTDQCRRCYQSGHHGNSCPDLWRQYHRTIKDGPPVVAKKTDSSAKTVYCYNCTAKGHYGHECPEERRNDYNLPIFQYIVRYDTYCHLHNDRNTDRKRKHDKHKDDPRDIPPKHRKKDHTKLNKSYTSEHCNRNVTECRDDFDRRQSWPQKEHQNEFTSRIAEKVKKRKQNSNSLQETVGAGLAPTQKESKKKKNMKETSQNSGEQTFNEKPKSRKQRQKQRKKEQRMNQDMPTRPYNSDLDNTVNRLVNEQTIETRDDSPQTFFGLKFTVKNEHFSANSSLTERLSTPEYRRHSNSFQGPTFRDHGSFQTSNKREKAKNFATGPHGAKWPNRNKPYDKGRGFQSKKKRNHTL